MHQTNFKNGKYPTILPLKIKDMNDSHDKKNWGALQYKKKTNNFARCQWVVVHSNILFYAYSYMQKKNQKSKKN